jgi:hypothetical protein
MEQLTVKQLYLLLGQEIKNGNGDKAIVVADDNEGNAYHGLFYGVTSDLKDICEAFEYSNGLYDSQEKDPRKVVILG